MLSETRSIQTAELVIRLAWCAYWSISHARVLQQNSLCSHKHDTPPLPPRALSTSRMKVIRCSLRSATMCTLPAVVRESGNLCHCSQIRPTSPRYIATTPRFKPTSTIVSAWRRSPTCLAVTTKPRWSTKDAILASIVNRPFVCTHPDTLQRVDDKMRHWQPRDVYQSIIHEDSVNAQRDLQQVTSCLFLLHLLRCTTCNTWK